MAIIDSSKLDFWIENKLNVLFVGKHGVGKTHSIIDAFNRHKLNWLYFSASTLDPFVDLIGVPKEVIDDQGNRYLDLIRPKALQNDEVEAIFFDEYNRSKPKVRNAVMELIQFGSINGKKFNNLKVIWAAINPDDEEDENLTYDVERLDPAQKDRFHVILDIPYAVDKEYLTTKYGSSLAAGATEWWNGLTKELKDLCSPRRLDYAVDHHVKGGDLYDILDKKLNVGKLIQQLNSGSYKNQLKEMIKDPESQEVKTFFSNVNNQDGCLQYIHKKQNYIDAFMKYYPKDTLSNLLGDSSWTKKLLSEPLRDVIKPIANEKLMYLFAQANLRKDQSIQDQIETFLEYIGDEEKLEPVSFDELTVELNSDQTPKRINGLYRSCHMITGGMINDWTDSKKKALVADMANVIFRTQIGTFDKRLIKLLNNVVQNSESNALNDSQRTIISDAMTKKGIDF